MKYKEICYWKWLKLSNKNGYYKVVGDYTEYYLDGNEHRIDGPAAKYNGKELYERWSLNGLTHKEDGPAIIEEGQNGINIYRYYYHGLYVEASSDKEYIKLIKLRALW